LKILDEIIVERVRVRMKRIKENILPLSLMFFIPLVNIFYALLNSSERGAFNLVTGLDNKIPFMEVFILPYVSWYGFIIFTLIYLCIYDRKIYYKTLISLIVGLVLCYITYFIFQTTVPRPKIDGSNLCAKLVLLIYGADKPYNCFPSIHVLTCFLMVRGIYSSSIKNKLNATIISLMAAMIIISTLFVKQHVIADVISGILLADIIFDLMYVVEIEKYILILEKKASKISPNKKLET